MRRVRTHNRPSGSPMNANAISRFLTVLKSSSVDEIVRTAGPMRRCAKATISSLVRSPSNWYTLSPLRLKQNESDELFGREPHEASRNVMNLIHPFLIYKRIVG